MSNQVPPTISSQPFAAAAAANAVAATMKAPPLAAILPAEKENTASKNDRDVSALASMTRKELEEELTRRNIKHPKKDTKDDLLEKLGVPAKQWKNWRKMKGTELKAELKKRSLKVSGNKEEMLGRLGVPTGFGESQSNKSDREHREIMKKLKKRLGLDNLTTTKKNKKQKLPEDDPDHEEYTIDCCKNFRSGNEDPAGCIMFPDGSCMEVWRCLNCGKIPQKPNAPPIHEYDEEGDELASVFGIARTFFG
jgi:hypothetical protein